MANELVMQVMKELARRPGSVPVISARVKEASSSGSGASGSELRSELRPASKPGLGLDSKEERFLRRLADGGRASNGAGGAAVSRLAEGRSTGSYFERGRETRTPVSAGKTERREMSLSSPSRSLRGRSAIGLDELAEREGRGRP
ncbi:hypothetical protein [uncultured Fretibacterium sp.]|uniref:hypothetical protein n=1 Tax=uncultured Fretibacterium sp. TaxID=1678694 RepID=UPI00261CB10F|nr:hypothetical protein [uncultured Fretibacterium sp.]